MRRLSVVVLGTLALMLACSSDQGLPTSAPTSAPGSTDTAAPTSAPGATDAASPTFTPATTDASAPAATADATEAASGGDTPAEADRAALIAIYQSTGGPSWTANENWASPLSIAEWHGVTTDDSGRVTALDLGENNLTGTMPAEIGELTALTHLRVGGNNLTGAMPAEIGDLTSLTHLLLGGNQLVGCLPFTLHEQLDYVESELSGLYFCCGPDTDAESGYSRDPPEFEISFDGDPAPANDADRDALVAVFEATDGESWDGSGLWASRTPVRDWPGVTLGKDGRVAALSLKLNGAEIPAAELGNLSGLEQLHVSGVTGSIPQELDALTNLRYLRIDGVSGPIPPELGALANLETLDLGYNLLCEYIPPELGKLTNLKELFLGANLLSGILPPELGSLANLEELRLYDNLLTGGLPAEWGNPDKLRELSLGGNHLTGGLPAQWGDLGKLSGLDLSGNHLSGELPPEWDNLFPSLLRLGLEANRLEGCVSDVLVDFAGADGLPKCAPADHEGDTDALIALHRAAGEPGWSRWLSREPIGNWQGVSTGAGGRVLALALPGGGN